MAAVRERVNTIRCMDTEDVSRAYAKQMSRLQAGYDKTARAIYAAAPASKRILDAATGPALAVPEIARLFTEASITALDNSPHKPADPSLAAPLRPAPG